MELVRFFWLSMALQLFGSLGAVAERDYPDETRSTPLLRTLGESRLLHKRSDRLSKVRGRQWNRPKNNGGPNQKYKKQTRTAAWPPRSYYRGKGMMMSQGSKMSKSGKKTMMSSKSTRHKYRKRIFYKMMMGKGKGKGNFVPPPPRPPPVDTPAPSRSPPSDLSTSPPSDLPTPPATVPTIAVWNRLEFPFPGWNSVLSNNGQYLGIRLEDQAFVYTYNQALELWETVGDLGAAAALQGFTGVYEMDMNDDGTIVGFVGAQDAFPGNYVGMTFVQDESDENGWRPNSGPIAFVPCTINDHTSLSGNGQRWFVNWNCFDGQVYEYSLDQWVPLGQSFPSFSDKVSISSDGQRIATYGDVGAGGGLSVREYNANTNEWALLGQPAIATAFAWFQLSGDGSRLVVADESQQVQVFEWNGVSWNVLGDTIHQGGIYTFAGISTDGNRVVFSMLPSSTESSNVQYADFINGQWQLVSEAIFSTALAGVEYVSAFGAGSKNRIVTGDNSFPVQFQVWELASP